jgi:hypothetical protein
LRFGKFAVETKGVSMRILLSSLLVLLGLSSAVAQPLANLAPANTLLSLSWSSQNPVIDTLGDDFAALNWQDAGATLERLIAYMAFLDEDPDIRGLLEFYQTLQDTQDATDAARAQALEFCPALEGPLTDLEAFSGDVPFEALLTVTASPFNPVPAVTALLRLDESYAPLMVDVRTALLACIAEEDVVITELVQDDVTLYVVDDAGDLPVVVGNIDNLFFIGSNPEAVRAVVRLAGGSDEPSLATTESYQQARGKLLETENYLGFSLNFAALAEVAEGFIGFVAGDPDTEYLANRLLAMLRTLGGVTAQISATEDGLVTESVLTVNPEGGDSALLELILCETCTVSEPFLAPEGAVGVSASYIPWREVFDYAQDWLDGMQDPANRIDLKTLIEEETGLDLDRALFNWLGSELHTYQLEVVSTDLRTLIYNPAQFSVIPVTSAEAARAGIEELGDTLGPLLESLFAVAGQMDPDLNALFGSGLLTQRATRSYDYRGVEVTRIQLGLNVDVAYAFVGDYLVIGTPIRATEIAIDTYMGERNALTNSAFDVARAAMPQAVSSYSFSSDRLVLEGLANLFDTLVQPLAFAVSAGLESLSDDPWRDFGGYYVDLFGVVPVPFEVPGTVSGTLQDTADDTMDDDGTTVYFELTDLPVGESVSIRLESTEFDPYLRLINANTDTVLFENDDYQGSLEISQITFTPEAEVTYWIEVTSPYSSWGGSFTVGVSAAAVPDDDLENAWTYSAFAEGVTPLPLAFGETVTGVVSGQTFDYGSKVANYYELIGLNPGDEVTVQLRSGDFDTYLTLIDAVASTAIDENDDNADFTGSDITFTASADVTYWVEVGSYSGSGTGDYTLTVSVGAGMADDEMPEVEAPSFAELLELFDMLPRSVRVLAEHASTSSGYSEVDGNTVYSRKQINFIW